MIVEAPNGLLLAWKSLLALLGVTTQLGFAKIKRLLIMSNFHRPRGTGRPTDEAASLPLFHIFTARQPCPLLKSLKKPLSPRPRHRRAQVPVSP